MDQLKEREAAPAADDSIRDLRWQDVLLDRGAHGCFHIGRGGSNGTTKGKRARFVPIHPELRKILDTLPRQFEHVFTRPASEKYPDGGRPINERVLLASISPAWSQAGRRPLVGGPVAEDTLSLRLNRGTEVPDTLLNPLSTTTHLVHSGNDDPTASGM